MEFYLPLNIWLEIMFLMEVWSYFLEFYYRSKIFISIPKWNSMNLTKDLSRSRIQRSRIIALVISCNYCYLKRMHKFGIDFPKSVDKELSLDKENGNTIFVDSISKDIKDVRTALNII